MVDRGVFFKVSETKCPSAQKRGAGKDVTDRVHFKVFEIKCTSAQQKTPMEHGRGLRKYRGTTLGVHLSTYYLKFEIVFLKFIVGLDGGQERRVEQGRPRRVHFKVSEIKCTNVVDWYRLATGWRVRLGIFIVACRKMRGTIAPPNSRRLADVVFVRCL